jgi:hypothetical protein
MNKLNTICNRQGWKLEKDDPTQSGPKHQPIWTANVFGRSLTPITDYVFLILLVKGDPFQGTGPSIQAAKEAAAKSAIEHYRTNHPEVIPSGF